MKEKLNKKNIQKLQKQISNKSYAATGSQQAIAQTVEGIPQ